MKVNIIIFSEITSRLMTMYDIEMKTFGTFLRVREISGSHGGEYGGDSLQAYSSP
jgi:hypothetical protein